MKTKAFIIRIINIENLIICGWFTKSKLRFLFHTNIISQS